MPSRASGASSPVQTQAALVNSAGWVKTKSDELVQELAVNRITLAENASLEGKNNSDDDDDDGDEDESDQSDDDILMSENLETVNSSLLYGILIAPVVCIPDKCQATSCFCILSVLPRSSDGIFGALLLPFVPTAFTVPMQESISDRQARQSRAERIAAEVSSSFLLPVAALAVEALRTLFVSCLGSQFCFARSP